MPPTGRLAAARTRRLTQCARPSPLRDRACRRPAGEGANGGGGLNTDAGELAAVVGVRLGQQDFGLERDAVDDKSAAGLDGVQADFEDALAGGAAADED